MVHRNVVQFNVMFIERIVWNEWMQIYRTLSELNGFEDNLPLLIEAVRAILPPSREDVFSNLFQFGKKNV